MDLELEMSTSIMISEVEKLLPSIQRREWALVRNKVLETNKLCTFKELLDFLRKERKAIEYLNDDPRTETKKVNLVDSSYETSTERQNEIHPELYVMKEMIEGLVQMVKGMSNNNSNNNNSNRFYNNNSNRSNNNKKCWYHVTDNHEIKNCYDFNALDPKARIELVKENFVCFGCLQAGHLARNCSNTLPCPVIGSNGEICGRRHHEKLHIKRADGLLISGVRTSESKGNALLMLSDVSSERGNVTVLWDPGANVSLLTHNAAQRLGLKGKEVTLKLTKVGNHVETIETREYIIPLIDNSGKTWKIHVYGMEDITSNQPEVQAAEVRKIFNVKEASLKSIPKGQVDVLIGTDWCKLLPDKIDERGSLQLMRNQFGYCVRGHHPSLQTSCNTINHLFNSHVKTEWKEICILNCQSFNESLQNFMDTENLGTQNLPIKCGGCKCGTCVLGNKNCTIKEERELHLIGEGLTLNENEHVWTIAYPWIKPPKLLANNYSYALSRLKSLERKLSKRGGEYSEKYNIQMEDMLTRNVARKLSTKEVHEHNGDVYYLPHHEVVKLQSQSTPMRVVFDASARYMGQCINDFWPKGPNVLNDILAVILRFRQFNVAFVADIKKMYNSIKLSKNDQNTHRFLWRWMNIDVDPSHYVLLTVPFGDRPSGVIASLALQRTANMMHTNYPEGANVIENNSYVDDLLSSSETTDKAIKIMKEVEAVLKFGGFSTKHWIISGEPQSDILSELGDLGILHSRIERVLGMLWSTRKDTFSYNFNLDYDKGGKGLQSIIIPKIVTPRMMLSQLAKIYDPLGLVSPFTLEGKILMRKTLEYEVTDKDITTKGKWDITLSHELRGAWVKFFETLQNLEDIEFKRCLKPPQAIGKPELIIFTDASETAYGSCAYARWKIDEDKYDSHLIMAKNRISPKRKLTIPRLELCAAVIGSRLRKQILSEMDYDFERTICMTDSMIVKCQIHKESYGFKTFTAVRVAEIQQNSEPKEWLWVETKLNAADIVTRKTELSEQSLKFWKEGPEFLKHPFDTWPVKLECDVEAQNLPDRYMVNSTNLTKEESNENFINLNVIDLERFNSYKKLLGVTTILLAIAKISSFKVGGILSDSQCIQLAEEEWIRFVQRELGKNWLTRFQRLGPWLNQNGLIVVGERFAELFKMPWNQNELILLPPKCRFTYLYVVMIHNEDHTIDATAAKVRRRFWVPQLMKIVRRIKGSCVTWRKLDKKKVVQKMSSLPIDRLTPSPPFYTTFIDLFGPIQIRDTVKGRCRGKAFGVIFNCGTCRAVYLDVGERYDTDSFLLVLRRFIAIHGYPSKFISDYGTQIVAGSKEMTEIMKHWKWNRITQFGKNHGVTWEFNKSADAPWQNGCSESLIRLTKRNIASSIGTNILTISELQTSLFEIANLLNERPIGMRAGDPTEKYICPNDLLMGRASKDAPIGEFDINSKLLKRLAVCQEIVQHFWKVWQQKYFHTLLIRQQWHTEVRNLKKGDIVIVRDTNQIRGRWQMAMVVDAQPGKDGCVRDVTVKYKNNDSGKTYDGGVDIIIK